MRRNQSSRTTTNLSSLRGPPRLVVVLPLGDIPIPNMYRGAGSIFPSYGDFICEFLVFTQNIPTSFYSKGLLVRRWCLHLIFFLSPFLIYIFTTLLNHIWIILRFSLSTIILRSTHEKYDMKTYNFLTNVGRGLPQYLAKR